MRWLFPSRTPFIPTKCYASLYRYTTTLSHLCASFPLKQESYRGQKNFILLGELGDFAGEEVRLVGMKGVREGKSSRILPYPTQYI